MALAPLPRPQDDFYGPPQSKEFFEPFLNALKIPAHPDQPEQGSDASPDASLRLLEFQRKGYYLAYLSECPITGASEPVAATVSCLGPTLVRRIRLNYKPKQINVLGHELTPLVEVLTGANVRSTVTLNQGTALSASGV